MAKKFQSKYRGVTLTGDGVTFRVQCFYNGKQHMARDEHGRQKKFATEDEAARAYDDLKRKSGKKNAAYNFPRPGEKCCQKTIVKGSHAVSKKVTNKRKVRGGGRNTNSYAKARTGAGAGRPNFFFPAERVRKKAKHGKTKKPKGKGKGRAAVTQKKRDVRRDVEEAVRNRALRLRKLQAIRNKGTTPAPSPQKMPLPSAMQPPQHLPEPRHGDYVSVLSADEIAHYFPNNMPCPDHDPSSVFDEVGGISDLETDSTEPLSFSQAAKKCYNDKKARKKKKNEKKRFQKRKEAGVSDDVSPMKFNAIVVDMEESAVNAPPIPPGLFGSPAAAPVHAQPFPTGESTEC